MEGVGGVRRDGVDYSTGHGGMFQVKNQGYEDNQ